MISKKFLKILKTLKDGKYHLLNPLDKGYAKSMSNLKLIKFREEVFDIEYEHYIQHQIIITEFGKRVYYKNKWKLYPIINLFFK